jgi:hypothetical protein
MSSFRYLGIMGVLSVVISMTISACASGPMTETRYDNVRAVYMHEPGVYSFSVLEPTTKELKTLAFGRQNATYKLFADCPADKAIYAVVRQRYNWFTGGRVDVVIHVHDAKEIRGGGWNHGKFGSGTTTVIE